MLGQNRMKGAVAMELNPGLQRLRTQNRERLAALWRERTRPSEERDAEERQILRMMEAHQELHPLWDRLDHLDSEEINLGGMNPVVHVMFDVAIETQLADHHPPEAGVLYQALLAHGFSPMRARHFLGNLLTRVFYQAARDTGGARQDTPTDAYVRWLNIANQALERGVTLNDVFRRVGRNDLCPCGSGKKYKKCCIDQSQALELRPEKWAFVIPGGNLYVGPDYEETAEDHDPMLRLQNMSALANGLESMKDQEGAWLTLKAMKALIDAQGDGASESSKYRNIYQDFVVFALNHPEFSEEALEPASCLMRWEPKENPETYWTAALDYADLLTMVHRTEEAKRIYEEAAAAAQSSSSARLKSHIVERRKDWESFIQPGAAARHLREEP